MVTCSHNPKSVKVETSRSLELPGQPAKPTSRPMGNEGQQHLNANTWGHPLPHLLAHTLVDTHTHTEGNPCFSTPISESAVNGQWPHCFGVYDEVFHHGRSPFGEQEQKRDTINDLISSHYAPSPKSSLTCLWNKPSALGYLRDSQDPNTNRQDPRDQSGQGTHSCMPQYTPAHRSVPHTFVNTEAKKVKVPVNEL